MNIFITGATGLIGSKLCQFLVHKNHITALTRSPEKALAVLPAKVECVTDVAQVNFNDIDVVINLAGEPIASGRWTKAKKQRIYQSRIDITKAITAAINAADTPPHTFISGSAIGYYGRQPSDLSIDESFEHCFDEFSHHLCKDWEETALGAESSDTRVCLLRTGIVLAKNGGALDKMLPPFRFGLGGPISNGKHMMSWIHIDDMVQLILFIIKHPEIQGPINATAPNPVDNKTLSKSLAEQLSRPCIFTVPALAMKLAYGEMADLLLYGQKVVPKKLLDNGYRFRHQRINDAFEALGL